MARLLQTLCSLLLGAPLILALGVGGCDMVGNVKDAFAHSNAAAAAIERQVGKKPEVGFNYHNGSFAQVSVTFADPPSTPLPELEKVVRGAVIKEFQTEPSLLIIAFAYPKRE